MTVSLGLAIAGCGATSGEEEGAGNAPTASAPALHEALPDSIKESKVLTFAGDSHPPYRTVGPDGETITGIDKDFQKALGKVLGVRTEIAIVDNLPAALQGMLSDRYDAFNGPVKATVERERQFDTVTWMTTRTSYVLPRESAAGVEDAGDLCGTKVAVTKASVSAEQLAHLSDYCARKGEAKVTPIELDDTNTTVLAVQSGRAQAAATTQASAIDIVEQQKDKLTYVIQTEEQGATKDNLALFVPKKSGLGPVMHKAFQKLFDSGEYDRIMKEWGLTDVMVDKPLLNVATSER
ncbi:transporter substrate-binding domain-containing protein [Saccharomonospora halophila]|uniref:transporter substrate-binding domain-containing protein n=1 Tax=Saccharomonospora halophila TaxID=129922 RepID=UPI001E63C733|nr:transporter substrate-binding domain-containing protein [Saccharomonospora halophila]